MLTSLFVCVLVYVFIFFMWIMTLTLWSFCLQVYGAAIQFYEPYSEEDLSERQRSQLGLPSVDLGPDGPGVFTATRASVYSPLALLPVLQELLTFLYRYSISGPHALPIEKLAMFYTFILFFEVYHVSGLVLAALLSDYFFHSQAHLSLHAKCAIPLHSETTHPSAGELKMWSLMNELMTSFGLTWMSLNTL